MRYLLFAIILLAASVRSQDLEFEDPFEELDTPPVFLDFDKPKKKAPWTLRKRKKEAFNSGYKGEAASYCLCKCMKKGVSPSRAKAFKGKKSKEACLCECAV